MQNEILNESFQIEQNTTKRKGNFFLMKNNNSNKPSKISCLKIKWKGHTMNEISWVCFCVDIKQ
jgi:hypothetical protein